MRKSCFSQILSILNEVDAGEGGLLQKRDQPVRRSTSAKEKLRNVRTF